MFVLSTTGCPSGEKLTGSVGICLGAMVSGFVFSMYVSHHHCWLVR
ncbi:hypothetical protein HMPREF1254_0621 [Prevotella sp. BV3P1]|nr:hypothetical protein HMPREF1254_0621 [Prevotella sp. BV3P1]